MSLYFYGGIPDDKPTFSRLISWSVAICFTVLCKVISGLTHEKCALTPFTLHNELLCIRLDHFSRSVQYDVEHTGGKLETSLSE